MSANEKVSRRSAMKAGLTILAGTVVAGTARADDSNVQPKIDRSTVKYQYQWGPDGHHCAICSNFIAPAACRVVDGTIDPNGYCLAFAPQDAPIP